MLARRLLLLLLLAAWAAPLRAEGGNAAEAWTSVSVDAVDRMEALATRANGRKLFASRNAIYEEILAFDPDHAKARSWLKYKRRQGAWVRPRYTPPRDRGSKSARADHAEAWRAWEAWWRQEVLRIHRLALTTGETGTADAVLRFALARRPEADALRALAGEVRHGTGPDARWILSDTRRALDHRARFLQEARAAARAVPAATPGTLNETDGGDRFAWPTVLKGDTVRVVGAVSRDELARHLEIAESAGAVFKAVFGIEVRLPLSEEPEEAAFPLYVTPTREQGNLFLVTQPGIAEKDLAVLGDLDLSFLPTRPGAVVKTTSPELRWEATAHAVHAHFTRHHLAFDAGSRGAWAQEAVALYLAWLQVRTRLLHGAREQASAPSAPAPTGPFGRPDAGRREEGGYPVDATTDWYAQASAALSALTNEDVLAMASRAAPELGAADLLAGYGLAVYVLEAHPDRSAAFFRDIASLDGAGLDPVLGKHLGRDLAALRPHLRRWLGEMSELAPPAGAPR